METTAFKRYNAAIYVRLSKEDDQTASGTKAESNSISNQKQLILDFIKDKTDITVVSIREDDGYTGTDYDRPAFQHMMDDIKAGIVNCVIVKDLSRFGREYITAGKYIDRLFPYYGVRLIAINDGIDTITRTTSDDFNIMLKNLMNDNYCRDISIKIRSQLQVKRKNGDFIGAFAPYGYKKSTASRHQLVIDPYTADVIHDIFQWKLEGFNNQAIVNKLNNQGILSPFEYKRSIGSSYSTTFKTNNKALWNVIAIKRILENPVYIGTLVQGIRTRPNYKIKSVQVKDKDEWCIVEHAHEPIISPKDFYLVQRIMELDTRTSPNETELFPLAGLLYCAECGDSMIRKTVSSNNKKFYYYICSKHKKSKSCSSHIISRDYLESCVLKLLQKHIQTIVELNNCLASIQDAPIKQLRLVKVQNRLVALQNEIDRYRRLKLSAYEDMKDGLLSKNDFQDINSQYEERLQESLEAQSNIQKELNLLLSGNSNARAWISDLMEYRTITSLSRRIAIDCIERINVYEDKRIEVIFSHMQDYYSLISELEEYYKSLERGERSGQEE